MNSKQKKEKKIKVRERDGNNCWICGGEVLENLPSSNKFRASLDHIKDKSIGGTDELDNLKLAHSDCNEKRAFGRSNPIFWRR